mmetsp:Transcript_98591/g.234855  ORF Transcript_98591/g.234855 Transcript_98591/m.234855 type:complete len:247 (+) Transcript_98591:555-1295(+)
MGCLECLLAWIPPQRQLETILDLVCAHSWEHHGSWLARTSSESFSEANISFPEGHGDGRLIRQVQGHTNDGTCLHLFPKLRPQATAAVAQIARPAEEEALDLVPFQKAIPSGDPDESTRTLKDLNFKVLGATAEAHLAQSIAFAPLLFVSFDDKFTTTEVFYLVRVGTNPRQPHENHSDLRVWYDLLICKHAPSVIQFNAPWVLVQFFCDLLPEVSDLVPCRCCDFHLLARGQGHLKRHGTPWTAK